MDSEQSGRFVTLTRQDMDFVDYLLGKGPDGLRALPVESFALRTPRERVTFELLSKHQIQRPHLVFVLLKAMRIELLPLTWLPAIVAYFAGQPQLSFEVLWTLSLLLISLFFFHAAAFLKNDFDDHFYGIDRMQRKRGSQTIQKGWVSAKQVLFLSRGALILGIFIGAFILLRSSLEVGVLGLVGVIGILCYGVAGQGFKNHGLGEAVIGLCMGPLLTVGVTLVLGGKSLLEAFILGVPFGLAALMVLQLRQFETLISEQKYRTGTFISRLGFDRAQTWIRGEFLLFPLILMGTLISALGWHPLVLLSMALWPLQYSIQMKLKRVASPLSSELLGLSMLGLRFYFFIVMGFFVAFLYFSLSSVHL